MKRKITCLIVIFLLLLSKSEVYADAQEKISTGEELYIVFAVDHSGSMNNRDRQNMISEGLKAFVDTIQNEKVYIGYVAYNDRIISSLGPVSVQSQEQCEKLKESIGSFLNTGETDVGLGLSEACRILSGYQGKG